MIHLLLQLHDRHDLSATLHPAYMERDLSHIYFGDTNNHHATIKNKDYTHRDTSITFQCF